MALVIPSYIPIAEISKLPIQHEWDDWDPYEFLGDAEEATLDALAGVSDRGVITFAIGCAEWVVYRLLPHLPDQRALFYLEACWALVMGVPIALPPEPKESEWQGKILSPVGLSILTIINSWLMAEDGEADAHAGFAERLPLLVLNDTAPFIAWRDQVLKRLEHFHPYSDEEESMGNLVAREVLDPTINIEGTNQDNLVKRTLDSMNLKENPYIEWL